MWTLKTVIFQLETKEIPYVYKNFPNIYAPLKVVSQSHALNDFY